MQRLTFGGNNRFPIWASDSKRVVFQSDRERRHRHLAIHDRRDRRTADEARTGRLTCAGVVVSDCRDPPVQRHEGIRRLVVDDLASRQKANAVRRRALVVSHRRTVFTRRTMGGLREQGTGPRRRSMFSPFRRPASKFELFVEGANASAAQSRLVRRWQGTVLRSKDLRIRGRPRHDETVLCVRQRGECAETIPARCSQPALAVRRRTARQVRGVFPRRAAQAPSRCAPPIQVVLNWFEELRARVPPAR